MHGNCKKSSIKPAFAKIYKKFGIKPHKKGIKSVFLSGIIAIYGRTTRGFCKISFSHDFVLAVGKALFRGISGQNPAKLVAFHGIDGPFWSVRASYIDEFGSVLLWNFNKLPEEFGKIHKI